MAARAGLMAYSSSSSNIVFQFQFRNTLSCSLYPSSKCRTNPNFAPNPSQFLSSKSQLRLTRQTLLYSPVRIKRLNSSPIPPVYASQSNFFRVIQTVWKVGKDGIDAGTSLVPGSVPRPIARISVTVVAVALAFFVLKSFLSTAFFILAVMGLSYFTFIALNKDEIPRPKEDAGATSVDDSLEEARRIMDKYK